MRDAEDEPARSTWGIRCRVTEDSIQERKVLRVTYLSHTDSRPEGDGKKKYYYYYLPATAPSHLRYFLMPSPQRFARTRFRFRCCSLEVLFDEEMSLSIESVRFPLYTQRNRPAGVNCVNENRVSWESILMLDGGRFSSPGRICEGRGAKAIKSTAQTWHLPFVQLAIR